MPDMLLCIQRDQTDPYFNIAAEEFVLKEKAKDSFMLWRNEPSIIIGKHQNATREINHDYVTRNKIPVIRRISGGGTVYHDPGNINYSFTFQGDNNMLVDFKKYTRPVLDFMKTLGIDASFEGKSNLVIDGLKFSGNAAHIFKNKILHHGTLLFDSNLDTLNQAIMSHEERYSDKSVRSVRSRVTNISGHLDEKMKAMEFMDRFYQYILKSFDGAVPYTLTRQETDRIQHLADEKYKSRDWNLDYSPKYEFNNTFISGQQTLAIAMKVEKGRILEISIKNHNGLRYKEIEDRLLGLPHAQDTILEQLAGLEQASQDGMEQEGSASKEQASLDGIEQEVLGGGFMLRDLINHLF